MPSTVYLQSVVIARVDFQYRSTAKSTAIDIWGGIGEKGAIEIDSSRLDICVVGEN